MSDTPSTVESDHSVVAHPQAMSLGQPVFILSAPMWHSWLEFVYANRILSDQYTHLGLRDNGRCDCGKSSISYPHWPPSTVNEAFDQLNYLHNEHNTRRRHLAQQRRSFERAKASVHTDGWVYHSSWPYHQCIQVHSYRHEQGYEDDAEGERMEMLRVLQIGTAQQVIVGITGTNVQLIAGSERKGNVHSERSERE